MSTLIKRKQKVRVWQVLIIIFIIGILFWAIPILISALFLDEGGILVRWTAKDYLIFYGSFLAFIGTSILGIVSWRQNKSIRKEMNLLERNRVLTENKPDLILSPVITNNYISWDKLTIGNVKDNEYTMIQLNIDNVGNGIARNLRFQIQIEDKIYDVKYCSNNIPDIINGFPPSKRIDINSMKKFIISIDNELSNFIDIKEQNHEFVLIIKYYDYYENEYEQRYYFNIKSIHSSNDSDIPGNEKTPQILGRCNATFDIEIYRTTYPKLICINEDFNELYIIGL